MLKDNGCSRKVKIRIEKNMKCRYCQAKFKVTEQDYFIEGAKVTYICPNCSEEITTR